MPRVWRAQWLSRLRSVGCGLTGLALALAGSAPSPAQEKPCPQKPPAYQYLRYDEDFSYLRSPQCRTDPWDPLKYIALKPQGGWYLSLGGESRQTLEYFHNASWGQAPQSPPYTLERYMGQADLHLGARLRFFGQLKSGLEFGRTGGPRPPIDEDKLDLNQAFVDVTLVHAVGHSFTVRAGRQELAFGANRWVSTREGPNVHQTFDGVRFILAAGPWHVDAFATKAVETNFGFFDDEPDPGRTFWGVYVVRPLPAVRGSHIDLYYLGFEHGMARFNQGTARELRHMLGTRLWGSRGAWDYDLEPAAQWGRFGPNPIRAWGVESDTGYTATSVRFKPRLGLIADAASGDRSAADLRLQTFNPLFPRGVYDQIINLNGHSNFLLLQPTLSAHLHPRFTLTPEWSVYWRESLGDGVYGVGGNLVRPAGNSSARYVGSQPTLLAQWNIQRHISVVGIYAHFFPGPFLRQTGPARNVNWVTGWIDYKF
ncbi:MAG TPA: alginate export family protein [Terriglobia bacterium]|nr:alginate export family protein [Terriglobia bacterium]